MCHHDDNSKCKLPMVLYQQNYMREKKGTTHCGNKIELKFKKWNAFKRNKEIFDISLIDTVETQDEMNRRVPFENYHEQPTMKFENSLLNSTTQFTVKLEKQTEKFKKRFETSHNLEREESQSEYLKAKSKQNPFTIMLPRENVKKRASTSEDERLFNNYSLREPDLSKTRDFDKYLGRRQHIKTHIFETVPILQTSDEERRKRSASNFKKQLNRKDNLLYPKFSSFLLTELDQRKVEKGRKISNVSWKNTTLTNFEQLSLKQNPCQFQLIYHSPNCNYRTKKERKKKEVEPIKIKTEQPEVHFSRSEICDIKYFSIKRHREARLQRRRCC